MRLRLGAERQIDAADIVLRTVLLDPVEAADDVEIRAVAELIERAHGDQVHIGCDAEEVAVLIAFGVDDDAGDVAAVAVQVLGRVAVAECGVSRLLDLTVVDLRPRYLVADRVVQREHALAAAAIPLQVVGLEDTGVHDRHGDA